MHIKSLFLIFCLSYTLVGFSQSKIKGKIIDRNTGTSLSITKIINVENSNTVFSDENGDFELLNLGVYSFEKEGYIHKIVDVNSAKYLIIQLEVNPLELKEIIISTNHIPEKLQKATTSIDIISSNECGVFDLSCLAPCNGNPSTSIVTPNLDFGSSDGKLKLNTIY